jgi:2-polyprenyl-3-methyl-5-hydroxy-6-metoxy-1,4-benzoquinol methylase
MDDAMTAHSVSYAPGHATSELDRLIDQGRWLGDLTAQLLRDAGLRAGMTVLDVGCGAGDVSFLAAQMVGADGSVIGDDRAPEPIALATSRAAAAGLANVRFVAGDIATLTLPERVDFVVGRLVLMYQPDPIAVVRHLGTLVNDNGVLAFHEFDIASATSEPRCPLFEATIERIRQTFVRAGIGIRTGLLLGRLFEQAGLAAPTMTLSARVEGGPDARIYAQLTGITRAVLPLISSTGVASAESIDIDTLESRLRDEAVALDATIVPPPLIGAWTRR